MYRCLLHPPKNLADARSEGSSVSDLFGRLRAIQASEKLDEIYVGVTKVEDVECICISAGAKSELDLALDSFTNAYQGLVWTLELQAV